MARKELGDGNASVLEPRLAGLTAGVKAVSTETANWPAACSAVRNVWNCSLLLAADNAATGTSEELQFGTAWICAASLCAAVPAWHCVSDAIGARARKHV